MGFERGCCTNWWLNSILWMVIMSQIDCWFNFRLLLWSCFLNLYCLHSCFIISWLNYFFILFNFLSNIRLFIINLLNFINLFLLFNLHTFWLGFFLIFNYFLGRKDFFLKLFSANFIVVLYLVFIMNCKWMIFRCTATVINIFMNN